MGTEDKSTGNRIGYPNKNNMMRFDFEQIQIILYKLIRVRLLNQHTQGLAIDSCG